MLLITLNHCSLEDAEHLFILCSQGTTYSMLQPFVGLVFFPPPKYRTVAAEPLYENSIKMCNAP